MDDLQAAFIEARDQVEGEEPLDEAYALVYPVVERLREATIDAGERGDSRLRSECDRRWTEALGLLCSLGQLRRDIRNGRIGSCES